MPVQSLLLDLEEDDLRGFISEEISRSTILDMVCAVRSLKMCGCGCNFEEWLQSNVCELSFQHMMDTDIANAATKEKGEEEGGEE
jgi:hypothetical protein